MEEKITTVPMSALHPHPRNAEFFDDADPDSFAKLKDSIAELGLLTPLRVSKDYTIISGHQRYRACQELGVEYISVIVDDELEDENEKTMQLIASNFGRAKNDPEKQAALIVEYEKLMGITHGGARNSSGNNFRLKQDNIAKEFGVDARTIRNLKRFGDLPKEVKEAVKDGKFSVTSAVKVVAAMSVDDQLALINSLPEAKAKFTQKELQEKVMEMARKVQYQQESSVTAQKSAMDKARQEADALIASAKTKARELEEAAHKSSLQYQEAHEAAKKEEERLASLKEQANALSQQMRDARKAMEEQEDQQEEVNLDADRKDEQIRMLSIQLKTLESRCMTLEDQLAKANKTDESSSVRHTGRTFGEPDYMPEESYEMSQQIIEMSNRFMGILDQCNHKKSIVDGFNAGIRGFVNNWFHNMINGMNEVLEKVKEV